MFGGSPSHMERPRGGFQPALQLLLHVSANASINLQTCENKHLGESTPQLLSFLAEVSDIVEQRQVIPPVSHCPNS